MRGITKIATSVAVLLHLLVGCSSHSGTATTPSTVEQPSARRLMDLTDARAGGTCSVQRSRGRGSVPRAALA